MRSPEDTVAARLRNALSDNPDISVRELARRLARFKGGGSVENSRRNIYKWLGGTLPEKEQQRKLSSAFDLPPDHFKPGELEVARTRVEQAEEALRKARLGLELAEAAAAGQALEDTLDQQHPSSEEERPQRKPGS